MGFEHVSGKRIDDRGYGGGKYRVWRREVVGGLQECGGKGNREHGKVVKRVSM